MLEFGQSQGGHQVAEAVSPPKSGGEVFRHLCGRAPPKNSPSLGRVPCLEAGRSHEPTRVLQLCFLYAETVAQGCGSKAYTRPDGDSAPT